MATGPRENDQELRLALAMRGGASMAVWIGGASAEINRLRRVLAEDAAHPWSALAKLVGYDSVSVDVLAGTSAGGLNATLLSASLVYGIPFDDMRGVWIRLADLEAMARPVPKFWQSDPDSLLEGDEYFRNELVRILKRPFTTRSDGERTGARAELLLTATLLDPLVEQHFDGRGGTLAQQRRTASFRFRHLGRSGSALSDFGTGRDFPDTVLRLAHAARSTSSFPFAFEPAQVHSGVGKPPPGEPDMFGFFSEAADDTRPYRVIDGGVLDNIPVTAAIRSIADAPAARPTERWLLYLNPEPMAPRTDRPAGRQLALPVVSVALQAKLAEESLLADIDALEEHNREVQRRTLVRRALYADMAAAPPDDRARVLAERVGAVRSDHAVVRAELDAQAVHLLLTQPSGIEDGKLVPPVVGDPLAGWSPAARTELAERLRVRMAERARAGADELFADARALLAAVQQCLSWVWDIERWAVEPELSEIGARKGVLYRLRVLGEVLEGHADQYWINAAKQEPIVHTGELDDWVDRVMRRRERLHHQLPAPIRPLVGAVLEAVEDGERFDRALAELAAELLSIVESSGADAVSDHGSVDADQVDVVALSWSVLDRTVERLATAAPPRGAPESPEQVGYALLEGGSARSETLRQLVVLTAPLDVGRVPGSPINLLRVSGNQQTPLPFDALRGQQDGALVVSDKLRGGDLGNFAAFLSARWRANDWMWGRLDAATSLLALLLDPKRLVRRNPDAGAEGVCHALGEIVRSVGPEELDGAEEPDSADDPRLSQWREHFARLWAERADEVRAELDALFADPEGRHPLTETRKTLTERLHWTIVGAELPFVGSVAVGADTSADASPPTPAPKRLETDVRRYDVGRQRLADLGERRLATVATRFGLLAYRAARPSGAGVLPWLGRRAMSLVKPLLLAVVFAVAAPKRAALAGFLMAAAVSLTGLGVSTSETPPPVPTGVESSVDTSFCPPADAPGVITGCSVAVTDATLYDSSGVSYGPSVLLGMLFLVVFAVWLGYLVIGHGRGWVRWIPALILAATLIVVVGWPLITGFRLDGMGLALVMAALTWFVTCAYRPEGRLLAALVTAIVFAAVTAFSGWLPLAFIATGYLQMVLLGTVDVLRPRPRQ